MNDGNDWETIENDFGKEEIKELKLEQTCKNDEISDLKIKTWATTLETTRFQIIIIYWIGKKWDLGLSLFRNKRCWWKWELIEMLLDVVECISH